MWANLKEGSVDIHQVRQNRYCSHTHHESLSSFVVQILVALQGYRLLFNESKTKRPRYILTHKRINHLTEHKNPKILQILRVIYKTKQFEVFINLPLKILNLRSEIETTTRRHLQNNVAHI